MRFPLLVAYGLLIPALCVSLVPANIAGLRAALLWQDVQRTSQYRLYDYQTLPDSCIGLYYPASNAAVVRDLAGQLSQTHYGIFAVPPHQTPASRAIRSGQRLPGPASSPTTSSTTSPNRE